MFLKIAANSAPVLTSGPLTPKWLLIRMNSGVYPNVSRIRAPILTSGPLTGIWFVIRMHSLVMSQLVVRFEPFVAVCPQTLKVALRGMGELMVSPQSIHAFGGELTSGPITCQHFFRMESYVCSH